ncbi:hypothetical protein HC752_23905 [Vibrio sp. S9_S30]|uniref:hypothetical protein n=1 Tax=Vibrio sp. S9_S30 TaxID=2720226 RepID=UPI00167FFEFB|nr:hypothetical protein [Vibrio sp. S9_S30]MBD1559967.1 hypothetical protein [Vibrio sp. S9_S30]
MMGHFYIGGNTGELCRWVWTDKANRVGTLEDGDPLAYATIYRRLNGVKFALRQLGRSFNEAELNVFKEMLQGIGSDELKLIFKDFNLEDQIDLRDRALIMLLYRVLWKNPQNCKLWNLTSSMRQIKLLLQAR